MHGLGNGFQSYMANAGDMLSLSTGGERWDYKRPHKIIQDGAQTYLTLPALWYIKKIRRDAVH